MESMLIAPPIAVFAGSDGARLGRQGKSLDGCWSDVSDKIEIFGLPPQTPCWRLRRKRQQYQMSRAPSTYPQAARSPPLLLLLQCDNYMP
jgi:hypothetical protein